MGFHPPPPTPECPKLRKKKLKMEVFVSCNTSYENSWSFASFVTEGEKKGEKQRNLTTQL